MSPRPSSTQPPLATDLFPTHVTIGADGRATPVLPASSAARAAPAGRAPLQLTHLRVQPWPDPVIDARGVDPRSGYVEQFWLGLVGPASVLLVRHLAVRLEQAPDGFDLDLAHTARLLGLGTGLGRWGPMQRTIHRCVGFGFARRWGDERLLVRRTLPPVTQQQLAHLPEDRQVLHERWRAARAATAAGQPAAAATAAGFSNRSTSSTSSRTP